MRRSDLATAIHIAPGLYVVDGDEGDPDGIIVNGPLPDGDDGRVVALELCAQLHRRTGRPASLVLVANLPA